MKELKKLHIATSRPIGQQCIEWARANGFTLSSMEDCDVFVSILYDKIIPEEYIQTRPCYNFHPGVLPWYRGAGAFSWAIMNGECETGVTLHKIDQFIDRGDIIHIRRFPIIPSDTAENLFRKAEDVIFELFKDLIKIIMRGELVSFKQEEGRIYYRKDLEKARDLTKFVKAFSFKGKPNAYFINKSGQKIELKYE